jgi:hypothetical protein
VCPSNTSIGRPSTWIRLAAFRVVAWLIFSVAMLGSPPDRLGAQSKHAYVCSCSLGPLKEEAYCPLSGLQFSLGHYEPGESELKSSLLLSLQGRRRA